MNLDRITSLLASGLKPAQVATIIGVTPARISQLLSQEGFQLSLQAKLAVQEKEDVEEQAISAKYNAAEHALVNQVIEMAPTAELRDVTAALRVVAERQEKMKTRTSVQAPILHQQLTVVSVNLPAHALRIPEVHLNPAKEVVAIGEQQLAPMTSTAVTGLFTKLSKKKGEDHVLQASTRSTKESAIEDVPLAAEQSFLAYAQ